mgnify:FL=1
MSKKHLCKYIVTCLHLIDCAQNQILKSCPAHKGKNQDFILIGSEVTTQTRLKMPFTLWHIAFASFDATQNMWWFLPSWWRVISNDIWYEWFRSNNFLPTLYLNQSYSCTNECVFRTASRHTMRSIIMAPVMQMRHIILNQWQEALCKHWDYTGDLAHMKEMSYLSKMDGSLVHSFS